MTIGVSGERETDSGGWKISASSLPPSTAIRTIRAMGITVATMLLRRMRRRRLQKRGIAPPTALQLAWRTMATPL
jgi:hypothetical protein